MVFHELSWAKLNLDKISTNVYMNLVIFFPKSKSMSSRMLMKERKKWWNYGTCTLWNMGKFCSYLFTYYWAGWKDLLWHRRWLFSPSNLCYHLSEQLPSDLFLVPFQFILSRTCPLNPLWIFCHATTVKNNFKVSTVKTKQKSIWVEI